MKGSGFGVFVLALVLFAVAGSVSAQMSDRDHPIAVSGSEITGSFIDHQDDNNKEVFYSFMANPGELTIVFDVKNRRRGDMASIAFELLGRNGSTALLCCEGAQSGEGGTGRETVKVKIPKRESVILHLTNATVGGGSYDIRLSGAGFDGGGIGQGSGMGIGNGNRDGDGRGDHGDTLNVPASGTLHIRMKNGTTKDIDLSLIRSVSIRP